MNGTVTIDSCLYGALLNMLHRDADNGMGDRAEIIDDLNESVSQHENDIATLRAEHDTLAAKVAELSTENSKLRIEHKWAIAEAKRLTDERAELERQEPWGYAAAEHDGQSPTRVVKVTPWETLVNIPIYTRPIPAAPAVPSYLLEGGE